MGCWNKFRLREMCEVDDMRRLLIIVLCMIFIVQLSGCINKLSSEKIAEYYRMEQAYEEMSLEVDTSRYEEAILFLVSVGSYDKQYMEENKEKFGDIIDENVLNRVMEDNPRVEPDEALDDFTNWEDSDEDIILVEDSQDGLQEDDIMPNEDGLYPIYGDYMEIIGYGTKEESLHSIEEFNSKPTNTINYIGAYKDFIVARINNKYTGEFLVVCKVSDGRIIDYEIFR